jgi:hypothetical protein
MDFLTQWVKINFVSLKRVIYDDCKLIMYLTPLILDSDNIKISGSDDKAGADDDLEKEKIDIIRPLMLFLDTCTCEPDENVQFGKMRPEDQMKWAKKPKKDVKSILKQLYE